MTSRPRPILDQLRALILSGELRQGERLLEETVATRLGISRTPLRPALAALAEEGLLQPRGRRGYIVRSVSLADLMDAFQVRAELEGLACRITTERGLDSGARDSLERLLHDGDTLLAERPDDFEGRFRSVNEALHALLLEQSGNALLIELTGRALARPLLSGRVVHFADPAALARSHNDHWEIYRCMLRGEANRAGAIMAEHILRSRDIVRDTFPLTQ